MAEDLLHHYNSELRYLRELGREFGARHPDVASRLRPSADTAEDPHVTRLVEGAAFVAARVHKRLDDTFPELVESLLGVVYPHYEAPIPSMSIVQAKPSDKLDTFYEIPRGTEIDTEPVTAVDLGTETRCRFRTAAPLTIAPIAVERAELVPQPFEFPGGEAVEGATSAIRIGLRCTIPGGAFDDLRPQSLRFHLAGQLADALRVYEALFHRLADVALVLPGKTAKAVRLGREALTPGGFDEDEGLFPYTAQSHPGYRLLSEYFAFQQKFLFANVDLAGAANHLEGSGPELELIFYLREGSGASRQADRPLRQGVTADAFALGCAPVINLFERRAEPITVGASEHEFLVDPNARAKNLEVYSVDRVDLSASHGQRRRLKPLFGIGHFDAHSPDNVDDSLGRILWTSRRVPSDEVVGASAVGSQTLLSLADLGGASIESERWVLEPRVTCMDRDLPERLPFGEGRPRLELVSGGAPLSSLAFLSAPTPTRRPYLRTDNLWRLVSHLSLNHLTLSTGEDSSPLLREVLGLYSGRGAGDATRAASSVVGVQTQEVWRPVPTPVGGAMAKGLAVEVEIDESALQGHSSFLFVTVLERFLALHAHVNSFVEVAARRRGNEGIWHQWTPRTGGRAMI